MNEPQNMNAEEFEKIKQTFIENGFDWNNGWAFLPFFCAGLSMFSNPADNIKENK